MRQLGKLQEEDGFRYYPELIDVLLPKGQDPNNPSAIFLVQTAHGMNLFDLLEIFNSLYLTDNHIMTIACNLLSALKYMHSANVLHRDIKSSNVLIDERCQVRICDFGLARSLPSTCIGESSGNSIRVRNAVI